MESPENTGTQILVEAIVNRLKTLLEYISVVGLVVGGFGYPAVAIMYIHLGIPLQFSTHETAIRAGIFPALLFIVWVIVVTPSLRKVILNRDGWLLGLLTFATGFTLLCFLGALLLTLQELSFKILARLHLASKIDMWSWFVALGCLATVVALIRRFISSRFVNVTFALLFSDLGNRKTSEPIDTIVRSIMVGGLISYQIHRATSHLYATRFGQSLSAVEFINSRALPAALFFLISASFAYCSAGSILEPTLTSNRSRPVDRRLFESELTILGWKTSDYQVWLYVAQILVFFSASIVYSVYAYPRSPEILGGGRPITT